MLGGATGGRKVLAAAVVGLLAADLVVLVRGVAPPSPPPRPRPPVSLSWAAAIPRPITPTTTVAPEPPPEEAPAPVEADSGAGAGPRTRLSSGPLERRMVEAATHKAFPVSIVAQAAGPAVAVYDVPEAPSPRLTLGNPQESGSPLVFLVREEQPDWLNVLLPVRPNGSTGWVRRSDVTLTQHRFGIVIELRAHRITVLEGDRVILQEPVGVGTASTPTPGGLYYLKELLRPDNPNGPYGPYAYGLSGFSNVLTSFAGGPGVIGIHGTNSPSSLGRNVSHGCIRMSNRGITFLAQTLPLGVPVEILA